MKFTTTSVRPLLAVGAGLAVAGAALLPSLPSHAQAPTRSTTASSAPPQGAYWHTRTLLKRTSPRQLGRGANRYWVVEQHLLEGWTTPEGKSWYGSRQPGAYPKSAADRAAWRRDGSPAQWSRTADGQVVKLSTKPTRGHVTPGVGQTPFMLGGQKLTYDEVQRLPADPDGLKSWLGRPRGSRRRWTWTAASPSRCATSSTGCPRPRRCAPPPTRPC
ncbi:hypothetical protein ACFQYP_49560 [Nonomuraea antimicrobica]